MTVEQRVVLINAAICRANIRAIAMQAENLQRVLRGESAAYDQDAFLNILDQEGINDNSIIAWLQS